MAAASIAIMLAPRPTTRLTSGLPSVVEVIVGEVLDLMIHSIEGLRDQLRRLSVR
jgi:hypothetical protein